MHNAVASCITCRYQIANCLDIFMQVGMLTDAIRPSTVGIDELHVESQILSAITA